MKAKNLMRLLFLMSLLIISIGCGKKGPPTLPQKPSSLVRIEHEVQRSRPTTLGVESISYLAGQR